MGGFDDVLGEGAVVFDEQGAQGVVAGDEVADGGGEGCGVEVSGEGPDRGYDVLGGGSAELVDDPECLLAVGGGDRVGERDVGDAYW